MAEIKTTIPRGSWVLVTGASGFVASHVVKEFLQRGYKVRGTVRDLAKYSWLVQDLFKTDADKSNLEIVQVPDLAAEHAFDEAVKGVSAIIHVATIGFYPNPNNVIPKVVAGTRSLLEVAIKEPSVQQFVYTSSIAAMISPQLDDATQLTADTWNDEAVSQAWAPPPYERSRAWPVYAASKTLAEKAVWEFVNEKHPKFTVNTVVPAAVFGECLSKTHAELGHMWPRILYEGNPDAVAGVLAMPGTIQHNVKDCAILHVAAVLDPDVKNARLIGWGQSCTWNDILAIMRKLCPNRKFLDEVPGLDKYKITADDEQSLAILKRWTGQYGWTSLEESIAQHLPTIVTWYP
ncbi:hypothetical protein TMatcc_004869 [Talaromyces marneffei ATCC 18224]|uniref:NAD dependent epimerase/dehydratase, putative n=2 Tax=Talaromyces marneffei TaxID=37727 RepID=B6Q1V9_TALMQ|nr:NAD dependent epimerase/dehydratase, putative [Talaromyces marneffei ATCC 18224]KAE8557418.1 hypothetical protein EYB25_002125 [Talaromyces marneffei]